MSCSDLTDFYKSDFDNGNICGVKSGLQIKCELCDSKLTQPIMLSCLHVFDKNCLLAMESQRINSNQVNCPKCDTICSLSNFKNLENFCSLSSDLPNNTSSNQQSASYISVNNNNHQDDVTKCFLCTSGEAAIYKCPECAGIICERCYNLHKEVVIFQSHNSVQELSQHERDNLPDVVKYLYDNKPRKCSLHKEDKLEVFCMTCYISLCGKCVANGDHKQHNMAPLDHQLLACIKPQLVHSIDKARQTQHHIKQLIQHNEYTLDNITKSCHVNKQQIHEAYDMWKQVLEIVKSELLTINKALHDDLEYKYASALNQYSKRSAHIDHAADFVQHYLLRCPVVEASALLHTTMQCLENLQQLPPPLHLDQALSPTVSVPPSGPPAFDHVQLQFPSYQEALDLLRLNFGGVISNGTTANAAPSNGSTNATGAPGHINGSPGTSVGLRHHSSLESSIDGHISMGTGPLDMLSVAGAASINDSVDMLGNHHHHHQHQQQHQQQHHHSNNTNSPVNDGNMFYKPTAIGSQKMLPRMISNNSNNIATNHHNNSYPSTLDQMNLGSPLSSSSSNNTNSNNNNNSGGAGGSGSIGIIGSGSGNHAGIPTNLPISSTIDYFNYNAAAANMTSSSSGAGAGPMTYFDVHAVDNGNAGGLRNNSPSSASSTNLNSTIMPGNAGSGSNGALTPAGSGTRAMLINSTLNSPLSNLPPQQQSGGNMINLNPVPKPPFPSRNRNYNPMVIKERWGSQGSTRGQLNSPHGFCLGFNEEIVVADTQNHRIQIFSKDGQFITQFGIAGREEGHLWHPRKVTIIRNTQHYVVCDRGSERSRMQIFAKNGYFIRKIAIPYIDIVAGLAINSQGHIVAVDSVSPTIFVVTEAGEMVKWIECSSQMREPSDIVVHGDNYYICDFKGHCVCVYKQDGTFLYRFGNEKVTNYPNGIDVSDLGDILVGDSHGNRFHVAVFQKDGLLTGEFECPSVKVSRACGLKITSEGYLVTLAKNNHNVLVIDTLYVN